jgi:serine/threonine protein kinase
MDKDGCAKLKRLVLMDFGISCITYNDYEKKNSFRIKGYSPYYMAPEQK